MSAHPIILASVLFCVLTFPFGTAQAQICDNVDPGANHPLARVSLPPKDTCSVGVVNGYPVPDPACTPGAINPTVTLDLLRGSLFRAACSVNSRVSDRDRAVTFNWYHLALPATGDNQTCELDYLIPLELGGADSLENIWPLCGPKGAPQAQLYFKEKILVNNYLLAQVNSGSISLDEAQREVATNWAQYLDAVHPALPAIASRGLTPPDTINLYFASTRVIERLPEPDGTQLELISTDERSRALSFGAAVVHVPPGHTAGQVERPICFCFFGVTFYRQTDDEKKHFTLRSTRWLTQDDFISEMQSSGPGNDKQALIFVHGYHNTMEDGLYRLAQIVVDTKFTGKPILFSWPSKGALLSYVYDRDSATASMPGLRQLIKLLQDNTDISEIHVIAHSMGNQIVVQGLGDAQLNQKALGQLVLAAPDVDVDVFKQYEPNIRGFRTITLYASAADKALEVSHTLSQAPRAGDAFKQTPPFPLVLPGMDTIDVTALGNTWFGLDHDTFASSPTAMGDVMRLLQTGKRPPNLRTPNIQQTKGQPAYWKFVQ
jgi:esterase/lipase superfamily enzyme